MRQPQPLAASILVLVAVCSTTHAHPGDGIVVTQDETIYFSDVAREVIWKLSSDGKLSAEKRDRWSHCLFLAADGTLFYEREVQQGDAWPRSLWKVTCSGKHQRVIDPQLDSRNFDGGPFILDDDGNVYFGYHPRGQRRGRIMKRTPHGDVSVVTGLGIGPPFQNGPRDKATIRMITAMTRGPDGAIYVADLSHVRRAALDGTVTTIAANLLDEKPADPPHRQGPPTTINRLYGLTVADDGTIYVAYHAGRRIIRISVDRKITTAYQAKRPWAPVGVAVNRRHLYVLESGFEPGSDTPGPRVRRVELANGRVTTLVEVKE